ncbi:pelargonidin 3-O-(6-caffeoylglucoside) 5-O-(6-O-malonylglucoside) 4'''-malonyltransferase-like [Apium graveolens]|uniref:pelargonidin 3-O-(6-caffeoylglucoside) 5-O-(6-O-malonylglucoside) 4'''-malonyltransferase-like n=1 Tax=Apium graveolens TaxID=4045 RepID=UPI003D7ABF94
MKVEHLSTEVIKPCTSTPLSLRDYKISIVDELAPVMNVPVILYYPTDDIHSSGKENGTSISKCMHLKKSLSKVLTRFYPFAGRYMKDLYMVNCSDQGAEFVEAKVDIRLDELIGRGKDMKVELLNSLLPRPIGAGDEVTDPMLAVQVSVFACGGCAIGVLSSHRIADISTISTLIKEWATDAKLLLGAFDENDPVPVSPIWNSASLFPGKKMSGLPLGLIREKENIDNPKFATKKFYFSSSAIAKIRKKARLDNSSEKLPTRVQSLWGIIGKAIIDINVANPEKPRGFLIIQAVNMRERTDPPIPKNQCGNLYLISTVQSLAGEKGVEFQGLVDNLTRFVKRDVEVCKMLWTAGNGAQLISQGFNELIKCLTDPEMSCVNLFTDWSKSPFYEADFGWGKPVWVSSVNVPVINHVYLLRDKSGEGIEAWVNLKIDDMPKFEQDSNIMEFTT